MRPAPLSQAQLLCHICDMWLVAELCCSCEVALKTLQRDRNKPEISETQKEWPGQLLPAVEFHLVVFNLWPGSFSSFLPT